MTIKAKPKGFTKSDLKAVSDNPEWTRADFARAKKFGDVFPDLKKSIRRGRPKVESPKEAVTLRLSPETIARFREQGDDWRTRMAKALDKAKA